ncbi:MAG: acyltransferase [Bryobacteraceae bacterium]
MPNGTTLPAIDRNGRLIQLDSLRALAVFGVFITHSELHYLEILPWGVLGVDLFFVLSGFVITRILLNARLDNAECGMLLTAGRFYARRLIRLVPPYYAVIAVFALVGNAHIRTALLWHLTYTSNLFFAMNGDLNLLGGHFWTLAVEEQFYIFWPWLVLLFPIRLMKVLFGASVVVALGYRWWSSAHAEGMNALVMLPANIDRFAIGGFVALQWTDSARNLDSFFNRRRWIVPSGALAALLAGFLPEAWQPVAPLLRGLGFGLVIHAAGRGIGGRVGQLLESRTLRYLGLISYGLYVYHPFCSWLVAGVLRRFGLPAETHPYTHFILFSSLSILTASASWSLLEKPFSRLKNRFEFGAAQSRMPVTLAAENAGQAS